MEPSAQAEEFRVPLYPFDGGVGPDKVRMPRSYQGVSSSGVDATNQGFITLPPKRTNMTLTSAAAQSSGQARMCVEYNSKLWILSGRYVHSINTSYSVSTERDLGASVIGTFIAIVNTFIVVSCGASGFIQVYDGAWATSADTYAHVIMVAGDKVHRVRSTNGTVDNTYSAMPLTDASSSANIRTAANWDTPATTANYVVGDDTYQVTWGVEFDGIPWFGRADGLYKQDTQATFKNQTPQIAQGPVANNCIGTFVAFGALWVPYRGGLLRVMPGESIARGPEIVDIPSKGWRIAGGFEHNEAIWCLAVNEQGTTQSLMKIIPDKIGATPNEYIYHEVIEHSATNQSRWCGLFMAPTNPTVCWGGGTATTSSNRILLGRGAGRDIDDSNYAYDSPAEIVTGHIYPARGRVMEATLHGVDVLLRLAGTSPSLGIDYNVNNVTSEPSTAMQTDREGNTGNSVTTTGMDSYRFYAALTGAKGSMFNFKFTLTQGGSPTGNTRSELYEAWAFGVLHPRMTDVINFSSIPANQYSARGTKQTRLGFEAVRILRKWQSDGQLLELQMPEYEPGRTVRVQIIKMSETGEANARIGPGGKPTTTPAFSLSLKRLDYAGAYAS